MSYLLIQVSHLDSLYSKLLLFYLVKTMANHFLKLFQKEISDCKLQNDANEVFIWKVNKQ